MFTLTDVSQEQIKQATEECFLVLYKAPSKIKTLDELRYMKFMEKVAVKGSAVLPHTLRPTSSAARYHGYRVYYQVMEWMGAHRLVPEEWGWILKDQKLLPLTTNKKPAPNNILEMIHCN